jgi:hypothetical protein
VQPFQAKAEGYRTPGRATSAIRRWPHRKVSLAGFGMTLIALAKEVSGKLDRRRWAPSRFLLKRRAEIGNHSPSSVSLSLSKGCPFFVPSSAA